MKELGLDRSRRRIRHHQRRPDGHERSDWSPAPSTSGIARSKGMTWSWVSTPAAGFRRARKHRSYTNDEAQDDSKPWQRSQAFMKAYARFPFTAPATIRHRPHLLVVPLVLIGAFAAGAVLTA